MSRTGAKGVALPGGPAGAFAIAFGAVGAVYLMMKYVRRLVKNFNPFKDFKSSKDLKSLPW